MLNILNFAMGVAGILITLLVFIIGYRKTIGARDERVKTANKDIALILARLIANPKVKVDKKTVEGIMRSKAREYNVSTEYLNDISIIIEDIVTKYIENEFMPEEIKNSLIEKARELLKEEKSEIRKTEFPDLARDKMRILMSTFTAMIAMIIVSIVSFGTMRPGLSHRAEFPTSLLVAMSLSLSIATVMAFIKLSLDKQKRIRNDAIYRAPMLEEIVFSALGEYFSGSKIEKELLFMDGMKIDFVIERGNESVPVEVKYILDSKSLTRAIEELRIFIERLKAKKGLLLVNTLVTEKDNKLAAENNIIIIENAVSKKDIIRQLEKKSV